MFSTLASKTPFVEISSYGYTKNNPKHWSTYARLVCGAVMPPCKIQQNRKQDMEHVLPFYMLCLRRAISLTQVDLCTRKSCN